MLVGMELPTPVLGANKCARGTWHSQVCVRARGAVFINLSGLGVSASPQTSSSPPLQTNKSTPAEKKSVGGCVLKRSSNKSWPGVHILYIFLGKHWLDFTLNPVNKICPYAWVRRVTPIQEVLNVTVGSSHVHFNGGFVANRPHTVTLGW